VAGDKGLLATDESTPTCNKRFAAAGIAQIESARQDYRQLLVRTPGLGDCSSGAILYDETVRQHTEGAADPLLRAGGSRVNSSNGPIEKFTVCV
jgi:fructose-bisphosphate aldolase class I